MLKKSVSVSSKIVFALLLGTSAGSANPQDNPTSQSRSVPVRILPVPSDVSAGMQKIIAAPLNPDWNVLWSTGEEWRAAANRQAAGTVAPLAALRERLHVTMTASVINGVRVHILKPDVVPPEHRDKVLVQVHGGCYVLFPGASGTQEAVMMAGFGHYEVIAVDYRMPPEAYFPAALDDSMAVYREVLKNTKARNVGVLGTSAGGALVLEMMLRAKQENLPMPGAIAPSTPMSDVTKAGDSFFTNEMVDNVLVSRDGFCDAATKVYAHGHDLADPLLSPVYGDMKGFPPAILTTGTRDLLLSNTVRVHRKMREAGVEAELEVYEGQSHAQFGRDDRLPETREAYMEIVNFFEKHLGK